MAQEWRRVGRFVSGTSFLNEVPEHMAQECASDAPYVNALFRLLNEVPEHMAQECSRQAVFEAPPKSPQ